MVIRGAAARSDDDRAGPESETTTKLLAQIFQGTAEGMALVRISDGRILAANDAFCRLAELPEDELIGASSYELGFWAELGDEGTARATLRDRAWLEDLMASIAGPSGKLSSMKISAETIPSSRPEAIVLVRATNAGRFAHSTERFRMLREVEARYRSLVEQLPAIVHTEVADPGSPTGYRDIYISPQTEAKLGYSAAEWRADPELWQKVTQTEDLDHVLREEGRSQKTGEPFSSVYRNGGTGRPDRVVPRRCDARERSGDRR